MQRPSHGTCPEENITMSWWPPAYCPTHYLPHHAQPLLTAKHLPPNIHARTGEETNTPSKTKQNKTKKLQKRSDRTDSQLAVRKCKNGACNGKPRRGGRENTTLFSDSHTLRTRLSRVHENWPRLEGNADNHVQYVTSANAMRVLCFNFKWRAEMILRQRLPGVIETTTQTYQTCR